MGWTVGCLAKLVGRRRSLHLMRVACAGCYTSDQLLAQKHIATWMPTHAGRAVWLGRMPHMLPHVGEVLACVGGFSRTCAEGVTCATHAVHGSHLGLWLTLVIRSLDHHGMCHKWAFLLAL